MSRQSSNYFNVEGRLITGYDYEKQAWVMDGRYVRCGHPDTMKCKCYGRLHSGEKTEVGHYQD